MNIAITGATGLLGSHLLLEWIKTYLSDLSALNIYVFGRQKNNRTAKARVHDIILGEEGFAYLQLQIGDSRVKELEVFLKTQISYIDYDLNSVGLGISPDHLKRLRHVTLDFFFHIASMTDFRDTSTVIKALHKTNYQGTENILSLVKELKVKEFIYIGTCYSRGDAGGKLPPDFVDLSVDFRNPYEKSKLEAECMVRKVCIGCKQRFRVFRPSTICGRLIELPFGAVTKYDVFYSWVAWCLRMKLKMSGMPIKDMYQKTFPLSFRIACREDSGLNIVPVDYAAKVIYQVCIQQDPGESYYLVNNAETMHRDYVCWMLEVANVSGTTFVRNVPEDFNDLETFYYKTIGSIFTPYVSSDPMLFDTENLRSALACAGLECPSVDRKNFMKLMMSAKACNFGLKDKVA